MDDVSVFIPDNQCIVPVFALIWKVKQKLMGLVHLLLFWGMPEMRAGCAECVDCIHPQVFNKLSILMDAIKKIIR
jgi:hypothetical protein